MKPSKRNEIQGKLLLCLIKHNTFIRVEIGGKATSILNLETRLQVSFSFTSRPFKPHFELSGAVE